MNEESDVHLGHEHLLENVLPLSDDPEDIVYWSPQLTLVLHVIAAAVDSLLVITIAAELE